MKKFKIILTGLTLVLCVNFAFATEKNLEKYENNPNQEQNQEQNQNNLGDFEDQFNLNDDLDNYKDQFNLNNNESRNNLNNYKGQFNLNNYKDQFNLNNNENQEQQDQEEQEDQKELTPIPEEEYDSEISYNPSFCFRCTSNSNYSRSYSPIFYRNARKYPKNFSNSDSAHTIGFFVGKNTLHINKYYDEISIIVPKRNNTV